MRSNNFAQTRRRASAWLLLASVAACSFGCGDDGYGRRYPVSGTVTYNGTPVAEGSITFHPDSAEGRAASGMIVNGKYSLTTVANNDGALPGHYQVTITAQDTDLTEVQAAAAEGGGAAYREDLVAQAPRSSLVPPKYSLPATSGLDANVEERRNTINFDLAD